VTPAESRFRTWALSSLGFTLLVILWGALVRATGSGAGCGSHWPTCNGEVLPKAPATATLIEFTHRITSGLALVIVVLVAILAFRTYARGHYARTAAGWSVFFMLTEALVGAGLVLFEKVAGDTSIARGYWMAAHLINTFLLVAAMTLTVWAADRDDRPESSRRQSHDLPRALRARSDARHGCDRRDRRARRYALPAASLREGIAQDFAHDAHPFVQLRVLHPFVAVAGALHLLVLASTFLRSGDLRVKKPAQALAGFVVMQVLVGVVNLLLAAPTGLQLLHLLIADLTWIALVLLAASATARPSEIGESQSRTAASGAAAAVGG
jgi:heme a synthase